MFWWKTIKLLKNQLFDEARATADWRAKYEEERAHSRDLAASLDNAEQNYRILKAAGERPTRRLLENMPIQDGEKVLENLAVEFENPLLQAVLSTIRANLIEVYRLAANPNKEDIKPGYYDGGIGFASDLVDDLLRVREEGMAKKAGVKK